MPLPLLILGFDAGDPDLLTQWAQEGHLPTLASVLERGWRARTAGPELIVEHGAWVSVTSGVSRREHGYHYYRQLVPGSYNLALVTGRDLGVTPFWDRLRGTGRRVAIVDVPDTQPIAGLPGAQVADWGVHNAQFNASAEPADLLAEVEAVAGPATRINEQVRSTFEQDQAICRQLLDRVRRKGTLIRHVLARGPFDLTMAVFGESHTGGHQFWKYRPGAQGPEAVAGTSLTHALRDLYQAIDREMGLILEQVGPQANVVLCSSVGLEDQYPNDGLMQAFLRQFGYLHRPLAGQRSRRPLDLIRRLVPERIRVAASRRLSREARERLMADQFRTGTDWSRTTAFATPGVYTSMVRVNLKGREPQGIVAPGAEYEAVLERLETDLATLIDPVDGQPAVRRTTRSVEMFGPDVPRQLPDLLVDWRALPRFVERLQSSQGDLVQQPPEFFRGSDHTKQGFVACAGPDVPALGDQGELSPLALAPMFLELLGVAGEGREGAVPHAAGSCGTAQAR